MKNIIYLFLSFLIPLASCQLKKSGTTEGKEDIYWEDTTGFTETELTLEYDTLKLPGKLVVPKGEANVPIVLIQSMGDEDMTFNENKPLRDIAYKLAQNGVASYRFASTSFHYEQREVKPDTMMSSPKKEVMEAMEAALCRVKTLQGIDTSRIFLSGLGINAQFTPWLVSRHRDVRGMIMLLAYARPISDMWLDAMKAMARQDTIYAAQIPEYEKQYQNAVRAGTESFDESVSLPFGNEGVWNDYREARALERMDSIPTPALVLLCRPEITFSQKEYDVWKEYLKGRKDSECKQYMELSSAFLNSERLTDKNTRLKVHHIPAYVINDMSEWIKTVCK